MAKRPSIFQATGTGVFALAFTLFLTAPAARAETAGKAVTADHIVLHRESWESVSNLSLDIRPAAIAMVFTGKGGEIASWESFKLDASAADILRRSAADLISRSPRVEAATNNQGEPHGERDWFELEIFRKGKPVFTACGEMRSAGKAIRAAVEGIESAANPKPAAKTKIVPRDGGAIRAVPLLDALRIDRALPDHEKLFAERVKRLRSDGVQITSFSREELAGMPSVARVVGLPRQYFPASECGGLRARTGGESNPFIETPADYFAIEYYAVPLPSKK